MFLNFVIYYINSSGHSGSSIINQNVKDEAEAEEAAPLNKLAKNSIYLPPLYFYLFKYILN